MPRPALRARRQLFNFFPRLKRVKKSQSNVKFFVSPKASLEKFFLRTQHTVCKHVVVVVAQNGAAKYIDRKSLEEKSSKKFRLKN
jgi:predicted mannosyl-3-phosphoglycerate phosphatase (HAD superfamily)